MSVVLPSTGKSHGRHRKSDGREAGADRHPPDRGRNAGVVHRLLDERHRPAGAAGRPRRPQARAPQDPVRDAGTGAAPGPCPQEERDGGGRRARQIPPARGHDRLRRPGPHGPGLLAALPAGGRPGELRLDRRRLRGGVPLHRGAARRHRDAAARGHQPEHGRLRPQLRQSARGAGRAAGALPQPARQRVERDRGRDEHQRAAPQPARDRAGSEAARRGSRLHRRGSHAPYPRARLPDRGLHRRQAGDPGHVPDRPWARGDAGARGEGDAPRKQGPARGHGASVRDLENQGDRADRGSRPQGQARRRQRHPRRVGP